MNLFVHFLRACICAFAMVAAVLFWRNSARAQSAVSSYVIGERVEVKATPWQDIWEGGVIREVLPQYDQVVVKSSSADRAFEMKDVRHLGTTSASAKPNTVSGAKKSTANAETTSGAGSARASTKGSAKVSVYVSGSCCYDGTIVGEGTGSLKGYYLIHFDNPSSPDQYAKAENVVPRRAAGAPAAEKASGPGRKIDCIIGHVGGKPVCYPAAAPG